MLVPYSASPRRASVVTCPAELLRATRPRSAATTPDSTLVVPFRAQVSVYVPSSFTSSVRSPRRSASPPAIANQPRQVPLSPLDVVDARAVGPDRLGEAM